MSMILCHSSRHRHPMTKSVLITCTSINSINNNSIIINKISTTPDMVTTQGITPSSSNNNITSSSRTSTIPTIRFTIL